MKAALSALALASALLPFQAALAANVTWSQEADLLLTGSGITLKVSSGSQANALTVNATSFTVTVAGGETFTVRYPGPYGTMTNDGGIQACNPVSGDNVSVVNGPATVTFTPTNAPCSPPSGGGGGGGGGSSSVPRTIRLSSPNGGETLQGGAVHRVFWTYGGTQVQDVAIAVSLGNGDFQTVVAAVDHASGFYDWTVPTPTADVSAKLRVQLLSYGSPVAGDESDAAFTIDVAEGQPAPPDEPILPSSPPEPFDPTDTIAADKGIVTAVGPLAVFCEAHELIKLADDGNPATQHDTAVYYCGPDGRRYAFPNPKIYATWYPDFSKVRIVSASEMSALTLAGNVTYRPGARLIKIQSDPKVYAVSHDGLLREIPDEATARAYFGPSWASRVDDIDVAFFTDYRFGPAIAP